MKKTVYVIRNSSMSTGTYLICGEYKYIYPGETIELDRLPTNHTQNVSVSYYRKELGETILQMKKKKTTNQK